MSGVLHPKLRLIMTETLEADEIRELRLAGLAAIGDPGEPGDPDEPVEHGFEDQPTTVSARSSESLPTRFGATVARDAAVVVVDESNRSVNAAAVVVDESNRSVNANLVVVDESNRSVNPGLVVVDESNRSVNPGLVVVDESNRPIRAANDEIGVAAGSSERPDHSDDDLGDDDDECGELGRTETNHPNAWVRQRNPRLQH